MRFSLCMIFAGLVFISCGNKSKVADEKTLFEQAQNFEKSQEYNEAYKTYKTIVDNYPQSPNRYKALFMVGYIQLEYLKEAGKASKTFESLIRQYPDCDLADDAKIMNIAATSGRDLDSIFQDSLKSQ